MSGSVQSRASSSHQGPIAVRSTDVQEFGCPSCGYRSASQHASGGGTALLSCGECDQGYLVLADGVTKSSIGLGGDNGTVYPELQEHPRNGTPAHGRPDKRPEGGGEFFGTRGIGHDQTPGCFVCGGPDRFYNNIAAFVQCKAAGERVVALFEQGALLDFRASEPDRVQVKIGACDEHQSHLEMLSRLTHGADEVITQPIITQARHA